MRLTKTSDNFEGMVWFRSQDRNDLWLEPCEMTARDSRMAIDKLAAYEDAEEQGLLVRLPCKVGDMVYYRRGGYIIGDDVKRIVLDGIDGQVIVDHNHAYTFYDFGLNVWTSREEAEAALKGESRNGKKHE